jgi:hypothetical protein
MDQIGGGQILFEQSQGGPFFLVELAHRIFPVSPNRGLDLGSCYS